MLNFITTNKEYQKLWKIFAKKKLLAKSKYKEAVIQAKKEDKHLAEIILADDSLADEKVLEAISKFYRLPYVLLRSKVISPRTINLLPKEISEQHNVVVFKKIRNKIYIAAITPDVRRIAEFVRKKTGFEPTAFITTKKDIKHALKKYKRNIKEDFDIILNRSIREALDAEASVENMAQFVPIIKIVNVIIEKAITSNASDIHIEPNFNNIIIRFRIDGIMRKIVELPKPILPAIAARIKILADLKIDEHMVPQDGRFQFNYNEQAIAVRVSIIPTLYGPKTALRLLEMKQRIFTLHKLGLNKNHQNIIKKEINMSQGMILVTGPTGSGKTTTLYTLLKMMNKEEVHICTIEDPIEYGIDNMNQMQIKPRSGLTFAIGLRALLRQDPNILMVGEIRDKETANIAVNAAMTGHLVLSTLHTNNAFLAPQRLAEMGLQPYLVNSVMNLIIGQRLVRKLCPYCKIRLRSSEKIVNQHKGYLPIKKIFRKLQKQKLLPPKMKIQDISFYRSRGCSRCNKTGYIGRMGIYEVLRVDDKLKKVILKDNSESAVKKYLTGNGALTMTEDGLLKVFSGQTSIDEILRVAKD